MIFDTKEIFCIFQILLFLNKNKGKYNQMFRMTGVSHTTLQRALREPLDKRFIKKHNIGHMNVDYEITEKGKKLLEILFNLNEILR